MLEEHYFKCLTPCCHVLQHVNSAWGLVQEEMWKIFINCICICTCISTCICCNNLIGPECWCRMKCDKIFSIGRQRKSQIGCIYRNQENCHLQKYKQNVYRNIYWNQSNCHFQKYKKNSTELVVASKFWGLYLVFIAIGFVLMFLFSTKFYTTGEQAIDIYLRGTWSLKWSIVDWLKLWIGPGLFMHKLKVALTINANLKWTLWQYFNLFWTECWCFRLRLMWTRICFFFLFHLIYCVHFLTSAI